MDINNRIFRWYGWFLIHDAKVKVTDGTVWIRGKSNGPYYIHATYECVDCVLASEIYPYVVRRHES